MISRFAIGAVFVLVLSVGCGPGSDMGYVTGVVTVDGEPLENGTVSFYPVGKRASVSGTKKDGSYELVYTREKMGAVIGEHKVTIVQEREYAPPIQGGNADADAEAEPTFKKVKIPRKYGNEKTTDLRATVEQGSNEFNFELKTE